MTTTNATTAGTKGQFTGRHMIAVMALFFGTIISVNLFMAYMATNSWTGLVVKNSYVASQHFNEVTAEKKRQLAMGWAAQLAYENDRTLALTLKDATGAAMPDAIVTAMVGRPAFETEDRQVTFAFDAASGTYRADTGLGPGIWQADIQAIGAAGEVWTRSIRIFNK